MDATQPEPEGAGRRSLVRRVLSSPLFHALVAVGIVALGWTVAARFDEWTGRARFQWTNNAVLAADATPLAAQVAGTVVAVEVADNQRVRKGDVIARIDPATYQAQLDLAVATRDGAAANLAALADREAAQRAIVDGAEAALDGAKANATVARNEANRQDVLAERRLSVSEQQREDADAAADSAEAAARQAEANLRQQRAVAGELVAERRQLAAALAQAEAQVALARTTLAYTTITAPADGTVAARQLRPGQFASVGALVVTLVPLPHVWATANLKETQMTNVRVGDRAEVTVDAFPGATLGGHVDSWSPGTGSVFTLLPPDNATGNFTKVVQRVPVKVVLDDVPAALVDFLRPGMSVEVTIDTGTAP